MLYVFIVSSGTMIQLDMNLAVKKVLELKLEISKTTHIPVDDQVLLCSGGEELKSDNMVGNYYGAGTDTNPIFLFCKYATDADIPFHSPLKTSIDLSIENDVKACASMAPSMQAISVRSNLAQRFADCALRGKQECHELVHHQHLQQQGWAAVIANLEDAKDSLLKRKGHFDELFQKYLANRSCYQETINKFPDDIVVLEKVPLLKKLIAESQCSEEDLGTDHTLLSWFCAEPKQVLETLVEKCQRSLEELNEHSLITLDEDLMQILKNADNPDIKEVRGIEERLSSLNKQIEDAKSYEKDQRELCKKFFNPAQINHARDPNVLPDICKTFQNQLELMLQNHKCLRDILERCTKAKVELSDSINYRVKYICQVESEMYDLQVKIIFLEKHVKSVMNQIESFYQVHLAPERYLKTLAEVCRRKEFSTNYMKWASELSSQVSKLYEKELVLRQNFSSDEARNMVDNLFPGMDDEPPSFAVQCPQSFDQNLPNITKADLDWLKTLLPELSHYCEVLPSEPLPHMSQAESDSAFSSNIPSSLKINSLENSHSNILKVHAKISALQKFVEELRSIRSCLATVKSSVKEELGESMSIASSVVEKILSSVEKFHHQMLLEKEVAVSDARKEFASIEKAYVSQLEVESQKLTDAEAQILSYEGCLREMSCNFEETKHEKDELMLELQEKGDVIKRMMLEHEIEFDSVKNQMKEVLQNQDYKIAELKEAFSKAQNEMTQLQTDKNERKLEFEEKEQRFQDTSSKMLEERNSLLEELKRLQEEKNVSQDIFEYEMKLNMVTNEKNQIQQDLKEAEKKIANAEGERERIKNDATIQLNKQKVKLKELYVACQDVIKNTSLGQALPCVEFGDQEGEDFMFDNLRKAMLERLEASKAEMEKAIEDERKEMHNSFTESLNKATESMRSDVARIEDEKMKKIEMLQHEHEEALEKLKSRITAENQVSFNEAINRLAKEKDTVIDDLRSKIEATHSAIRSYFDKYLLPEASGAVMSRSDSNASCSSKALQSSAEFKFLNKLKQEIEPLLDSTSVVLQPIQSSQHNLEYLKKKFRAKELEYQRILSKYIKSSGNPVCFQCCNKLSILSCEEGDVVLSCYDEKYRNFIVFHLGPFVHFLHSDSLQALNLKIPPEASEMPGSGSSQSQSSKPLEPPQRWAIGVVTHKEFCVTRKEENRYNVPVGTKFHRVKLRPWEREAAATLHQWHRSFKSAAASTSKSVISQSPSEDGASSSRDMSASSI